MRGAIVKAFNEAGYNAIGAEYNEILVKFGKFDILYMADFLEHLNDPKMFLKSIVNILRYEGLIIIDVPLVELNRFSSRVIYFYTKLRNKRIRFKSKPYHMIFFRVNSLNKLCRNAGYKIQRLKTWKENVFKEENYRKTGLKFYILNKLDHILPVLFGRVFDDIYTGLLYIMSLLNDTKNTLDPFFPVVEGVVDLVDGIGSFFSFL